MDERRPTVTLVQPGPLTIPTGGYVYNRRIVEGLLERGWPVTVRSLDRSFPTPTPGARAEADAAFAAIESGSVALVDSLVAGALPDVLERHAARLRLVGLIHLPLSAWPDMSVSRRAVLEGGERRSFAAMSRVVVTGNDAAAMVSALGVPDERIAVVPPGTDRVFGLAPRLERREVRLLCVATVAAGKGHEDLLTALARVAPENWTLTCIGSLDRDPDTVARVRATMTRLSLGSRVSLTGEADGEALDAAYRDADVFVLATRGETFGMAVTEAIAHGLPVVSTTVGQIEVNIGAAGLLVAPGDIAGLTEALERVIRDRPLRLRLGTAALERAEVLPDWPRAVDMFERLLEELIDEPAHERHL